MSGVSRNSGADVLSEMAAVSKRYRVQGSFRLGPRQERPQVHALEAVDLLVHSGETVGVIGESGSGKSTLGRLMLGLEAPTSGTVRFAGRDLAQLGAEELRRLRQNMGMVFQNPHSSLNRRRRVLSTVRQPLDIHRIGPRHGRDQVAKEALSMAGLPRGMDDRLPSELSGGQLQRVAIARAIVLKPKLIVADEPTASLDVSVRAQVINLFADLRTELGLALLFISHDLGTVSYLADRVAVMYLGRVIETGPTSALERNPLHPYTRALIDSIPVPDPRRRSSGPARGEIPSAIHPPSGCAYNPRCFLATDRCRRDVPPLEEKAPGRLVACWEVPGLSKPLEGNAPVSMADAVRPSLGGPSRPLEDHPSISKGFKPNTT